MKKKKQQPDPDQMGSLGKLAAFLLLLLFAVYLIFLSPDQKSSQNMTKDISQNPTPPVARVQVETTTHHGITVADPYAWLYDKSYPEIDDQEVLDYLAAENAYTEAVMAPYADLTEALYQEMKGRIPEEDKGVAAKDGPYFYSWRFAKGTQYKIWTRAPVAGGEEDVIFDENQRARGHDYYRLGAQAVSPDHSLLAFSEDTSGAERFTLRFLDIQSGRVLEDSISETIDTPVWAADGKSIFYVVVSENWHPYQVRRHVLGQASEDDTVVYEEPDSGFSVGLYKTHSRKFIVITTGDNTTSELRIIPADAPNETPALIAPRKTNLQYYIDHSGDTFYIRTNDTNINFRIASAPENAPGPENWRDFIPASDDAYLRGMIAFKGFLAVQERVGGVDQVRVQPYAGEAYFIDFPETVYAASLGQTPEFDTDTFRINYESMITPDTVFDYDTKTSALTTMKVQEIPSGYDKSHYETVRLMAPARDGVLVPVTLVYKKGISKDGANPLHLYGYGGYGYGIMPRFNATALSLVERGFIYAIAHVRGGDELGYQWYLDGKLTKRTNTFHDFVDVGKFLVAEGYTSEGNISIEGRSAGGELMGAVVNEAPELWRVALIGVPFVDVLNTMLNDQLPLTPPEWPEWGNPITDKAAFELILSYSPYDNIEAKDYPAMFISAGLNDPRVTYWEPAKWTARIRSLKTDDNLVLLKTNMGAGHAGKSGRFVRLHERAEEYAFLLAQFGMAEEN